MAFKGLSAEFRDADESPAKGPDTMLGLQLLRWQEIDVLCCKLAVAYTGGFVSCTI